MSLVQDPCNQYRNEIQKGRFYRCPYSFPTDSLVLVRPLYDDKITTTIQANIVPLSQCDNAFNHNSAFPKLKLKGDEEFTLHKTKMRRVVAISLVNSYSLVSVAPVYTLKKYHEEMFDTDKLKKNELPGLIYLEKVEDLNKESFISIAEAFAVYTNLLEPIRLELNPAGILLLDDNISLIYDLYSTSS